VYLPGAADETAAGPAEAGRWLAPAGGPVYNISLRVEVDARGATREDGERIGQVTADRIRQVIEEFVQADWYAVALQEV